MARKLAFISPIYSYTAETFVNKLAEIDSEEDLEIIINSPGGSVFAGWSIIGALNERKGKTIAKVYGNASSMAFYALMFMDEVVALDVATFLIHRADGYTETDEDKKFLSDVNATLRKKLEAKIDAEVFQNVTGVTFDEIFSMEGRKNVFLSAKEAKKIGLVDRIERLEPKQMQAMQELVAFMEFGEQGSEPPPQGSGNEGAAIENKKSINQNSKIMTKNEFKAKYPEMYAEIVQDGVSAERDRCEAYMEFADVDAKAVKEAIAKGSQPSAKFFAEMAKKQTAQALLDAAKEESTEPIATGKEDGKKADPEAEKQAAELEAYKQEMLAANTVLSNKNKEGK